MGRTFRDRARNFVLCCRQQKLHGQESRAHRSGLEGHGDGRADTDPLTAMDDALKPARTRDSRELRDAHRAHSEAWYGRSLLDQGALLERRPVHARENVGTLHRCLFVAQRCSTFAFSGGSVVRNEVERGRRRGRRGCGNRTSFAQQSIPR